MSPENSPKQYSIQIEDRSEYLYALVEGDRDSYDISKAYWSEVIGKARITGHSKLLIEEDIPEAISMIEMFQLASDLMEMGIFGLKIAFVDRYIDHEDLNKFGELVAINRGANARAFTTVDEGKAWLLGN